MADHGGHRILLATDGSAAAEAAAATMLKFPWPEQTLARGVVASFLNWVPTELDELHEAVRRDFTTVAASARRVLARRWPQCKVIVVESKPADAILKEASRWGATGIVLGWRGHGAFRRLIAGSVSRIVAEEAKCPVLVVRTAPRTVRRFVVGFDGCPNARRAVDFLSSLSPAPGSRVVLVNAMDPVALPATVKTLPASTRAYIRREAGAIRQERRKHAEDILAAAAARFENSAWKVKTEVRVGAPLASLLKAVEDHRADILVLGARATSGLDRALLGSVANGALNRSSVPVLVVR